MLYLLFPFYWAVNSSLKNENQLMMTPTTFIPRDPVTKEFSLTLDNYRAVFQSDQFIRGLRNSAIVAGATTLLSLAIGSFAAFALGKLRFRGKSSALYIVQMCIRDRYMEAHPDVEVRVIDTPDLATDRYGLYLQFFEARSSDIDVYQIDVIWPGDLAEHLLDLYEFGAKEIADEHFPAIIENNTVDGRLVGIPWFTDAGLLYYRTDLLEKYGLEVPKTWAEFEDVYKRQQGEHWTKF